MADGADRSAAAQEAGPHKRAKLGIWRKLLIVILVTTCAAIFCQSDSAAFCDHFFYGRMFKFRGRLPAPKEIAVVAIDESSFSEINLQWPWPRSLQARLLDKLKEAGVRTVAFDVLFSEASKPEEDKQFAEAIDRFGNVVLAEFLDRSEGESMMRIIRSEAVFPMMSTTPLEGLADVSLDADNVVRGIHLSQEGEPALALKAVEAYVNAGGGTFTLPTELAEANGMLVNFLGPHKTILNIPFYQALDPERYGVAEQLKDRLVFVGFATGVSMLGDSQALADHHPTPFGRMAGVEIHANTAQNLLVSKYVRFVPIDILMLCSVGLAFVGGLVFLNVSFRVGGLVFLMALAFGTDVCYAAFDKQAIFIPTFSLLFPFVACYVTSVFVQYWMLQGEKKFIRQAFSTYLAPRVVEQLIEHPERLDLGGEEQEATVVFLDLAGFTSFSEKLRPKELIELINRNLGAFASIVLNWDGMIDKYIGDCIMAVWGVPVAQANHAERACSAVLDILKEAKVLREKEKALTGASLSVRVGVNTGQVVAGNVGGGQQFNYTVLGKEVNLASRLEGINKYYDTSALISDSTAKHLNGSFLLREVDSIRVVGQKAAVTIYELVSSTASKTPEMELLCSRYTEAMTFYRSRNWPEAIRIFDEILQTHPEDGPSATLKERCAEYQSTPPPPDWDGVYQMVSK